MPWCWACGNTSPKHIPAGPLTCPPRGRTLPLLGGQLCWIVLRCQPPLLLQILHKRSLKWSVLEPTEVCLMNQSLLYDTDLDVFHTQLEQKQEARFSWFKPTPHLWLKDSSFGPIPSLQRVIQVSAWPCTELSERQAYFACVKDTGTFLKRIPWSGVKDIRRISEKNSLVRCPQDNWHQLVRKHTEKLLGWVVCVLGTLY